MERFSSNPDFSFFSKCSFCNKRYSPKEIIVVDKKEGLIILYFTCPHCKSAVISSVSVGALGIMMVSMITDLSVVEIDMLRGDHKISSDDILAIYKSFKN